MSNNSNNSGLEPESSTAGENKSAATRKPAGFRIVSEPVAAAGGDSPTHTPPEDSHKYDLGAASTSGEDSTQAPLNTASASENLGDLPTSYGLNRIYLVAKDPQWLFTYWDVDWSAHASLVRNGKVFLRILGSDGAELSRVVINPYAQNWYLPVPQPGATYRAELGYESDSGAWTVICSSQEATVPVTELQPEDEAVFARVPMHLAFEQLLEAVKSAMERGDSLVQALARLQNEGTLAGSGIEPSAWSPERRRIFEALLGKEVVERISLGSGMLDEELRKQIAESLSSLPSSELSARLGQLVETSPTSLSSGFGASWSAQPFSAQGERSFFMHVNAEVIFYGGTDPDATVWVDGKQIELKPDGTFSYHFKFPDGRAEVPIVAQSPDGVEQRAATLVFRRDTSRRGEVGHTRQPDHLISIHQR